QPPIAKQTVLAIDPGFRTGCKVAVLDGYGNLLEHGVIHPHQPQNRRHEAKMNLKDLVGKHKIGVVAIGNGTACRETEELVAEITETPIETVPPPSDPDQAAAMVEASSEGQNSADHAGAPNEATPAGSDAVSVAGPESPQSSEPHGEASSAAAAEPRTNGEAP